MAFAVGDVGFTTGQTLRRSAKNKSQTVESVWQVLEQGNAVLSNPHNHPEEATNAVSICPLLSMHRHRFGVVVSGAPALPDEYFECFCRTAGQMFERIGKLEIIWRCGGGTAGRPLRPPPPTLVIARLPLLASSAVPSAIDRPPARACAAHPAVARSPPPPPPPTAQDHGERPAVHRENLPRLAPARLLQMGQRRRGQPPRR